MRNQILKNKVIAQIKNVYAKRMAMKAGTAVRFSSPVTHSC